MITTGERDEVKLKIDSLLEANQKVINDLIVLMREHKTPIEVCTVEGALQIMYVELNIHTQ